MTAKLPEKPSGSEFEAAVAAAVMCFGYFVETRHTLRVDGKREILELDVLASRNRAGSKTERTLIEAKSSARESLFNNIFKLGGQIKFLDIDRGHIIFGKDLSNDDLKSARDVCEKLRIQIHEFDPNSQSALSQIANLERLTCDIDADRLRRVFEVAWYQQIAEQACEQAFLQKLRSSPGHAALEAIKKYKRMCELSLFEPQPMLRLLRLHKAFNESPKLFDQCVQFEVSSGADRGEVVNKSWRTQHYSWIQYALTLELRSKLLVIKCCFEHLTEHGENWESAIQALNLPQQIPSLYIRGMQHVHENNLHSNCPYILKLYTDLLGGMIVDEDDVEFLAAMSSASIDQVRQALNLFDTFFPGEANWSWTFSAHSITALKLLPGYSRGIGAYFRHSTRNQKPYKDITPNGETTLGAWHNAAYFIIKEALG